MAKLYPRSLKTTLAALVAALFAALPAAAVGFDIPADLGSYAVLSCKDLKIAGNSVVSSESLGGAQGEQGHVRSNADVVLDGAIEVHGDAVAGPGKQVRVSGQPLVTGEKKVAASPYACTPIDLAALRTALLAQNDNSKLPPTLKGKPALGGANGRTLDLNGKDELTLPAGTYLFDEVRLAGNARLRVSGDVRILVTGAIDVKGGSHIHLDGNPFQVRLWSLGTTVSIASQSNVHAFLYAPAAAVSLAGQSRIVGGVQADRVEILGGSRVRRVVDDAKLGLTLTAPQEGQSVSVCAVPVTGTVTHMELLAQLTVNGVPVTPAADGSFTTTTSLATADPGLVEAVATDNAGNTVRVAVRVRIVPPVLTLTAPDKPLVGTRIVSLAGTSGTATEVTVNGIAAQVANGAFHLDGFDLGAEDGFVDLLVVGRNCGGQVAETFVLDLDTKAPVVAIDSPVQGDLFGSSPITVTGTVVDAHLKSVTVNGVTAQVEGQRFTAEGVILHEGNNNLAALAVDDLGRQTASAAVTVQLDTTAPTVTITEPENGAVVSTPQIVVRGTVSDANLHGVKVNGIPATVTGTTFEVTIQLVEGENHLVATAVDAANHPAESPQVTVILDTLPPVITLAPLPALVDGSPVTVRGTVSDPHLDKVTVNGIEASVVEGEFVAEVPLQEGASSIVARAVDTLGHSADTAETAPAAVTLDTLAPQIAITEPQAGAQLASHTVTVRGTVADPHLDKVTVLEVEATVTGSTFEAVVELSEGGTDLTARAVDSLGHAAVSDPVPVVVDTLAPVVRLDSPQDPLVSTATVRVTGKAEDPHLDEVLVNGLPATVAPDGTFHMDAVPLVEGVNEIRATATDTFDNESGLSEPVVYVLDTTPPAIAITSPTNGQVMTSLQALVTGTVADAHLLGVTVNGVEATVDEAAGTFSVTVPLIDGANTLTAVATDLAGHTVSAAVAVVLDTQPPTVTLDLPSGACLAAGAPQTLGGSFVDANPAATPVTVEVTDAGGAKRTYAGTLSGTRWTASGVDLGAADGLTTVLVTAADVLGNTARVSASFRIDAAPPVVRLTLDGGAFPAGALFGRAIAAGVQVEDGPVSAPPKATLTLDSAPYAAGTLITAEGPHVLVATATDCAGHTTTVQAQFTIDGTPPALRSTTPAADARVTTAVTSFSGTSDSDLAKATVNGQPASVAAGGAFTLMPFAGREGRNEVSIELEDRAGNRASYHVAFTVRTVALSVEIREGGGPIPANATFLRPVRPDVRASDSTATVTATLNGAPFVSGTEIAQGGSYHLVANATDDWGRTAHAEARFSIDLGAAPQIAVTSPADGAVLSSATVRVEGTVSGDGGDAPTVTVNGVAATVTGGTWFVASLPLEADALNSLVATARDRFGRTATAGVTVRVASGGPQVLILEPADGTVMNRAVVDVAGAVVGGRNRSADGTVTVQGRAIELAPDGTFRALDVPLQSGANTLTATVKDRENRTGSAAVHVTADFTPPALRFLVRANGPEEPLVDGASFGRPVTLIVEVTDDAALDGAPRIRLNGALQANATAPRTEIALTASGGYVVAAAIEDAAGNEARAERSFVLDFGGCSLADVSPESGSAVATAAVSLVGRASGAAEVKVRVPQPGGGVQEYVASLADGTFLAGDVPLPAVGENRLELVCVDAVGGVQTAAHVIERLAADAGPVIHITAPAAGAVLGSDSVTVAGTVTNGAVTVNGLSAVVAPGTPLDAFSAANVPLSEGPNPLLARAVDAAGRSAEDRIVVQRDTQAPRVQITRPDNHSQVGIAGSGPAAIDVSGLVDLDAEPNLGTVVVSSSKGSVTATVDPQTGAFLAQGVPLDAAASAEQTLTVTATDTLGHSGTASVAVALDATGPALVLSAPADLTRFRAGAAGPVTVSGQAWAAPGTAISVNGIDLDPAGLAWSSAGADGRRHVTFTASVNLPSADGPFGIIARATDLQGRMAQDRRLLYRDTAALRVVEMVPADGATGVDANGLLLVLFSEPVLHSSLDAATGLRLTRVATGQDVVGSKAVAGQAVGFVPGAALAAGESYLLRGGTGITDVAGNALATAAEVRFTVAASSTGGAPVLQPLPAVLCADEIQVKGTAAPAATLKVRDGDLTFTGFADTTGAFTVSVPVTGSGYHLLAVWALDAVTGARSPEATAVVRVDCRAPSVTETRLDRETGTLHIVFSEAVDPATLAVGNAAAAIRLLDAEAPGVYQAGTLSQPGANEARVQLDTAANAWWRDRPVRLQVGPPAADLEGNAMAAVYERVFFPGGSDLAGGFLFGEVYDDTTGRPLAGVPVSLFASGQEGSPVAGAVTDGRGRFVLAGEVPAGRYVLVSAGADTTRVYRRLSLRPAAGVVPFDSRVTPLAEPAGTLEPAAGGSAVAGGLTFAADAAALPGASPVTVRLTPLSGQGLPDFLPLGWTPLAAAEVRLEQDGSELPEQALWTSGAASLELTLGIGAPATGLVAARYEAGTGRWLALPDPETVSAGRVRVALAGPGTVAVVVPDAGAAPSIGEPLAGVERPEQVPALVADLALDPPVVPPTGRARARVVARSADNATAWPSGLAVQAFLEERLVLTGGGEELEAPFSADLVLYHPALTPAEQGAAAASAAGAMDFVVSPSPRAAQVLLEVGWENIRLFPFPEEVERGPLVGPDGGTVDSPEGVELSIPEGALTAKVPVSATLLTATELAALPALSAIAGYDTLAAVRVDLSGATLARPATLALPKPSATPDDSQSAPRVVLAELIDAPVDGRGTLARMVSRTRREGSGEGERVVAAPELAGLLPLDGIAREGLYLLLAAQQPLGFSTGFVRAGNDTPVAHSRVTADGLGTGDMSRLTGRYAVPVPAGANRRLVARHPALDERGEGTIPSLSPGQIVNLDLTVSAVPPRVVSVTPADGAASQPLATAVSVLFSEALDPATVTSSTLTLELAGPDGEATGIFVDGAVTLSEGVRVVFAPRRPLLPGRRFRALFTGGVADAGGAIYAGAPVLWTFSTSTAIVPGGQVHPEKLHVRIPVSGVAEIYGEPGALPGALSGQVPWAVTPEIEGPVADPQRDTFQARGDGSFTGTVGHPPGFAVALGSRIWVKVFDPTGTLAAEFRVGPFTTPDGRGFVAPPGEDVTFRSADGLVVDVPAAAFSKPTLVRVRLLQPSALGVPVPQGLGLGAFVDVDFEGEARETLRLSVPAPANAADGSQVFIGQPVNFPWGRRLQVLSVGGVMERDGQRYLSNDPSLQPEPEPGALAGPSRSGMRLASGAATTRNCRKARQEGLPKCFLQSIMKEFTLRSHAAFMYELGADYSILTGVAGAFPLMLGISGEAILNFLADSWVYLPVPHDWNGGFVLPVLSTEPLELARRDTATGWVLARQTYDPVGESDGLIDVGFLGSGTGTRPLLIDAQPFQLYRLAAPEPDEKTRLALEMEMEADNTGAVSVSSVPGFKLPAGTTVALYDLAPATREEPEAPVAGPAASLCDPDQPWTTSPMNGSDDMLVVVSPGGLDAAALDRFELQFDQTLEDVTGRPVDEVARLLDLGPLDPAGCGSATESGYPKKLAIEIDQADRGSRLLITPLGVLTAGHRFRLEIVPSALTVDVPEGTSLAYWQTAPTRFEFATREVPGEPISELPGGPAFGSSSVARDMLKLGNLLLVASEDGDLVAVDVSQSSDGEGLRRYAIKNKGAQTATRALATDGHNRIFYAGLFGHIWGIKAIRLEDVRDAGAECASPPSWAAGLPCFEGVEGSVRIAYALGSTTGTTGSEWLALGAMPEGTPMKLSVLAQDEKGRTLELADFAKTYSSIVDLDGLVHDAEGIFTFDVAVKSTLNRSQGGLPEPSLPGAAAEPAVAEWRKRVCDGEEDYDRYQRVTVDNLTTGQTWSIDVENPWPDGGGGDGTTVIHGVRARKGDQLRVRYNLRTLGHVALLGSGITVVDLNRFYRLLQPHQTPGGGQCGRRLGKFEGQQLEFPSCAPASLGFDGIAMTPAVVTHGKTGCSDPAGGNCRGEGFIDIYSPLTRVGALHTRSTESAPGGVENGLLGSVEGPEALQFSDLAGCIQTVGGQNVMLRDVALANDVIWFYRGIHGDVSGVFEQPPATFEPLPVRGDLLFVSLGAPGIYVFDVSARSLFLSSLGGPALVGHLSVKDHSAFRLQVDPVRNLLFAGGTDAQTGKPVIDVWDIAAINGGPDLDGAPTPRATLDAPWSTNQLGIDAAGTGLVYTWGAEDGPLVVPFDRAQFVFSGLYRAEDEEDDRPISGVQQATSRFVPLGVPMEASLEDERNERKANEKTGTAAFKVRVALPGSLGPELTAKVQSLRSLPGELSLGQEDVGPAVALPGGPGWPENETIVRLRRVGLDSADGVPGPLNGESGRLGTAYQLYESVETVLLVADPRARADYRRQDDPTDQEHDEEAQCRRCGWPDYLPDPDSNDPALDDVKELLAGRYVRAFLLPSDEAGTLTQAATKDAIDYFEERGQNYPLPAGWAEVAGPADSVPSPLQVSLAEPAQSPALWSTGEAGLSVALPGGEALLSAVDHSVEGRALPFSLDRTYRSGMLGYGAFGSAGWSSSLFGHLRELPVTGEVEYHDGMGHVWRFFPRTMPEAPEGYEDDEAGSYYAPAGVYIRLQKLSGGQGWRLIGRAHDVALFDGTGRLVEASDHLYRGGTAGEQGNRIQLRYDPFGQLLTAVDDLQRQYRFEYFEDPRPEDKGGDGDRYGLLKSVTDFADREVEYEYDDDRRLIKVKLPEVENPLDAYASFSYTGGNRPTLEYRYEPSDGVSSSEEASGALLHGKFAKLRLGESRMPDFVDGVSGVPRVRFGYDSSTGRLKDVGFPTPDNQNSSASSVEWTFSYSGAFPPDRVTLRAPWGHEIENTLLKGRIAARREDLMVHRPGAAPALQPVTTSFTYAEDGRLLTQDRPDGSQLSQCYADGEGCGGGGTGGGGGDRLAKGNVVRSAVTALTAEARGSADYDSVATGADYGSDNQLAGMQDGLGRGIGVATPMPGQSSTTRFSAENVSLNYRFDLYGRVTETSGSGDGAPTVRFDYGKDAKGKEGAGLVERMERGDLGNGAFWQEFKYDDAYNVERVDTSQGSITLTDYDTWDRPVRNVSGLSSDGRFAQVGVAECSEGEGAVSERAYDRAGHVVRERKLQDYVDPVDGGAKCRWVEVSYAYNAREQLVSMQETHLASATTPGQVVPDAQTTMVYEYDSHGRLERERSRALSRPDLVKTHVFDTAGRVSATQVGGEGARQLGYDARSRVVFSTDGHEGTWQGRYDAWGNLYHEVDAAGAVVRRRFDQAGNPIEETVFDADPLSTPGARVLSDVKSSFNSFGAMERMVQALAEPVGSAPAQLRVTENVFDASGRMTEVWSGPPNPQDADHVDRSRARRDVAIEYEPAGGRVVAERFGGDDDTPPLHGVIYQYGPDSGAPWPDAVTTVESVPGEADLRPTLTTAYRRDVLGRTVEERRSDGSLLFSSYDRTGGVIRVRTGAGAESTTSLDSRGLPVKVVRPNGRGFTLYSYDLDGALLRQETRTASADVWATAYTYDATGRVSSVTYADGTTEQLTYNPDSTLQTLRTRDGLLLTHGYDAANRLTQVTPSAAGATPTLLDTGDGFAYDKLSRPTLMQRGRAGAAGYDPAFAVSYPAYDLASRPGSEVVGGRGPLSWRYDTWDRPFEVTLPAGPGRGAGGPFQGFTRRFDTLDRLEEVSGLGTAGLSATPLGAQWAWGGAGRLYGVTTKGALKTAARFGYHGGAGQQVPGYDADQSSDWKLGTLIWGGAGNAAVDAAPQTPWGSFGFGWRGNEGNASDGTKTGRKVLALTSPEPDLFAGMGWAFGYDASVRLSFAASGAGDLSGQAPAPGADADVFRFSYGAGDELARIVREATGQIAELETGEYGRILARNGAPFSYDGVGRRLEDDRFAYRWDWRGQLVSVTVKDTWPDADGDGQPDVTPWAGHQVRYDYDAAGRMTHRWQYGKLPEGVTDDAQRPFVEKRVFVWEGDALAAEAAYGNAEETIFRWRKTYVPGPSGLDDAVQVVVEDAAGTARTYTLLRDEMGTVVGLAAEDEGSDPNQPPVPARYHYTPYGEAHVETGPELDRARFDGDVRQAGAAVQTVADERTAAGGALVLDWSLELDAATLPGNLVVERLVLGLGWLAMDASDVAVEPASGDARLLVLARNGWQRGTSYRVRLTGDLEDELGRRFSRSETLEWRVPEAPANGAIPPVLFDRIAATRYESWEAARDDLGGRFPGGQTALFQGLWTDPVTGVSYARARWYDARNALWLSEDPMADTDSPNLYAFVGWQPNMATDPLGLCGLWDIATNEDKCGEYFVEGLKENFLTKEMLSTAISFIPGVGDVKDAQEAITGVDLITGRELSWMERGITVAAAVIPMVGGSALRHALGNAGEKAAREGVEALEEGAEQAMKRGADVAEEGAEHAARNGAERASREGAEALDDISPAHHAKSLDDAPSLRCRTSCFAAGTLVATAEGLLPIEQIQVGDKVYSYDDATGEEHLTEVVALHHRDVEATWVLEVGGEEIETTDEHPFYVAGRGWTEAKDLHVGDVLIVTGGDRLPLDKIERVEGYARVYNFEVRGLHSYFVGTVGVVVHNCDVPYSAREIEADLQSRYPGQVESRTIAPKGAANSGRVAHSNGIAIDERGFPVFDDVSVFDTRLTNTASIQNRTLHMREATTQLSDAIQRGEVSAGAFTADQLRAIHAGSEKIPDLTWHHHQNFARMQLVPTKIHQAVGHTGGFKLWFR